MRRCSTSRATTAAAARTASFAERRLRTARAGGSFLDELRELDGIDGLRQMRGEAGFTRALLVLELAPTGQRDEARRFTKRHGANPPCHLEAIHTGHAEIQ